MLREATIAHHIVTPVPRSPPATFTHPPPRLISENRESPTTPDPGSGGFDLPELTDDDISDLLEEAKSLPQDYVKQLKPARKSRMQYSQAELTVTGERGSEFKVVIRKNLLDPLDFSVILVYLPKEEGRGFVLRRYNGKHIHKNHLEGTELNDFHVHMATERYQQAGLKPEGYAEVTDGYASVPQATECLFRDANFQRGSDRRLNGYGVQ